MPLRSTVLGVFLLVLLVAALPSRVTVPVAEAQTGACPSVNAVPLFSDVTVIPPDQSVPADMSAFSGWWDGTWSNSNLVGILVVESITPPYATVVYAVADTKQLYSNSLARLQGSITDGKLVLHFPSANPTIDVTYTLQPDGTLAGSYAYNGPVTSTSTLTTMDPASPCPQHQAVEASFQMVSAGLLPATAPDATPGASSYLFRVAGFNVATLSADQLSSGLSVPPTSLGWRQGPGGILIVDMAPSDSVGLFTLSLTLPDGRQAAVDFGPRAPSDPLSLQFCGRAAGQKPTDPIAYCFRVAGTDIVALYDELGSGAFHSLVTAPAGSTVAVNPVWGFSPALVIQMPPSMAEGTYPVTFTLPNGQSVSATFQHTH